MRLISVLAVVLVSSVAVAPAGQEDSNDENRPGVFMVATKDLTLYDKPPGRIGLWRIDGEQDGVLSLGAVFEVLSRDTRNDPPWLEVQDRAGKTGWLDPRTEGLWVPIVIDLTSAHQTTASFEAAIDYYETLAHIKVPVPTGTIKALNKALNIAKEAIP